MSQCVPSWDLKENQSSNRPPPDDTDTAQGYEVAELTWENGQLSMHGLAPPRGFGKPISSKYTFEKPRGSGMLESIVNQAAKLVVPLHGDELVPWFDSPRSIAPATIAMDALVPSHLDPDVQVCLTGKSTRVESCGGTASTERGKEVDHGFIRKRSRAAHPVAAREVCSRNQSVSYSETFGRESRHVGVDSSEMDMNTGFTETSLGSDTNPNTPESVTDRSPQKKKSRTENEKNTRSEKSTISTKRSRAAAIHNQSERKRRDKINQKMKTLQKMVPNSSKTDKASMLDEVIEYLKTLQAQVQMMSMMGMPHMNMMMPTMNMQQQLQMAMMAQMSMGMAMGAMDMNTMGRAPNIGGMPQVLNPAAFMPMAAAWDGANDRAPVLPDPMASFLACQTQQPMTMDAYGRMAALHQQLQQQASKP